MINLIMFLPEFFLGSLALGFLFFGFYCGKDINSEKTLFLVPLPKGVYYGILGLLLVLLGFLWFAHSLHGIAFSGFFISDRLGILSKTIICLITLPWICFDGPVIDSALKRDGIHQFEHPSLLIIFLIGTFLTISAHHLFALYLGLELQMLPLYALISMKNGTLAKESALKYFLLSSIASVFLAYGLILVYGFVGSGDFSEILTSLEWGEHASIGYLWLQVGFFLILGGIFFKLGLFPFHFWTINASKSTSNVQIPFLLYISKISSFIVLIRILFESFHPLASFWKPILLWGALISLVIGSVGAFFQSNIRRLFAYAGIFHVGVVLLGLSTKGIEGAYASLLYLFIFVTTAVGFFFFWASLSTNDQNLDELDQLKGLSKTQPLLAVVMSFLLLSLGSLPPFAGFWSIFYLLSSLTFESFFVIGVLLFCNLITAACYMRVIKKIFFERGTQEIHSTLSWRTGWILFGSFVILSSIMQEFLLGIIRGTVDTL
jgi:NADH-quinone oxidoreductase subunit N